MEKILLAIDGSDSCRKATPRTAELANSMKAEVTLLTVIEDATVKITHYEETDSPEEILKDRECIQELGEKILSSCYQHMLDNNVPVKKMIRQGKPSKLICEVAEENDFDLIVVTDKGMGSSNIKDFLLGGTTEKVVRHSRVSVMVVK